MLVRPDARNEPNAERLRIYARVRRHALGMAEHDVADVAVDAAAIN
jgi:hypothetical protein